MAGRNFLAVTFFPLFVIGCGALEVPIAYFVSKSCASEAGIIEKAASSWSSASCVNVLNFGGISEDKMFETNDIQDGFFTVYCVDNEENDDANYFLGDAQGVSGGDIILRKSLIRQNRGKYEDNFLGVAAHEFGHRLRLGHMDYPGADFPSVMRGYNNSLTSLSPTKADIEGNGIVNGLCNKISCPAECPTRPVL